MTTGRINQVCALPTEAMPGDATKKLWSFTTRTSSSPKGNFGYALATGKHSAFVKPSKVAFMHKQGKLKKSTTKAEKNARKVSPPRQTKAKLSN